MLLNSLVLPNSIRQMQLFQINQSEDSSKITIMYDNPSGQLHQRSITWAFNYNRTYSTFVCQKFCRKIENGKNCVKIRKKHHNYRTAGGVSRQRLSPRIIPLCHYRGFFLRSFCLRGRYWDPGHTSLPPVWLLFKSQLFICKIFLSSMLVQCCRQQGSVFASNIFTYKAMPCAPYVIFNNEDCTTSNVWKVCHN